MIRARDNDTPRRRGAFVRAAIGAVTCLVVSGCSDAPSLDSGEGQSAASLSDAPPLSADQVTTFLRQGGFFESTIPKMVCAGWHASGWDPQLVTRTAAGREVGLFQIRTVHLGSTPGCPATEDQLLDPRINARCAHGVFVLQGMNAWPAYRANKAECDAYR